nr:type II toxin-antitoxin system RelE/ParE family toxin [Clostridia bacterium]
MKKLKDKIIDKIEKIVIFPEIGVAVNNIFITDKFVRKIVVDNYYLYYKADTEKKSICILAFAYAKRDQNNIYKSP